jgi:hypothetical protein
MWHAVVFVLVALVSGPGEVILGAAIIVRQLRAERKNTETSQPVRVRPRHRS